MSTICYYPFKHVMLTPNSPPTPCCRFHQMNLHEDDITDNFSFNNMFLKIRNDLKNGIENIGCSNCWKDESTGNKSMRFESFDLFTNDQESKLEAIELAVGKKCNLKCITCDPDYSTLWDKEASDLNMLTTIPLDQYVNEIDFDQFDIREFENINYIKVTGGEPFLHKKFFGLIERLVGEGYSKNIRLEIFTNCTIFPNDNILKLLQQFKKMEITISLDGFGELNDAIRFPSKWRRIERNFSKWKNTNFELSVAITISILNIIELEEMFDWLNHNDINFYTQLVHNPPFLSANNFSLSLKDKIKNRLNILNYPDKVKKRLLSHINNSNDGNDEYNFKRIKQHLDYRDIKYIFSIFHL